MKRLSSVAKPSKQRRRIRLIHQANDAHKYGLSRRCCAPHLTANGVHMAIALSDVRFRGQSGRQSQRAPGIREQPRPKADKAFKALPIAPARVSKS